MPSMDKGDSPSISAGAYSPLIEHGSAARYSTENHHLANVGNRLRSNICRLYSLRLIPIIPFALLLIGLLYESTESQTPSEQPIRLIDFTTTAAALLTTSTRHPNADQCNITYPDGELWLDTPSVVEKYIGLERRMVTCSKLGNFLYREASFYAFGKTLGRKRVIDLEEKEHCRGRNNFYRNLYNMPNVQKHIHITNTTQMSIAVVNSTEDNGARGEDPEKWRYCDDADLLLVKGPYFQSYTNFHQIKAEIRQLFQFTERFMENLDALRDEVFGNDHHSHKFCIHARRTDFLSPMASFLEPSHLDFAIPAAEYILQKLRVELANEAEAAESEHHWAHPHRVISGLRRLHSYFRNSTAKISVVLFSDDQQHFGRLIRPDPTLYAKRYVMPDRKMDSTMVMAFANKYCDSFLMTSSSSTFGWWMAYLMPEEKQRRVFYNIKSSSNKKYGAYAYDYRTYPTEWQRLHLNGSGIVEVEPRWIHELARDKVRLRRR